MSDCPFGIMQIKESSWGWLAKQLGVSLQTREGQIAVAAAILGREGRGTTPEERFLSTYYPTPCLDCKGEDGATPRQYLADMHTLMGIIHAAEQGVTPATTTPAPRPAIDPYQVIFNGRAGPVSYGFRADAGLRYYTYGVGHGTTAATQHTGDDVPVPDETPLYAPFDAEVTCVGAAGRVIWGQGCGFYEDYTDNTTGHDRSIGNITLLGEGTATGYKLVLGHCSDATVQVGQHVKAGQLVGYSGGMNGPHTHVEVAIEKNGSYFLVDPRPALIEAMGGHAPAVQPERVPYNLDMNAEPSPNLKTIRARTKLTVYQRADPHAAALDTIEAGDTFEVKAQIPGNDGAWWFLGRNDGRLPVEGTEEV